MSEQRNPRPASSKKSEAARVNGAKSRGPVSEAGKSRSSQNALKHGAYAAINANPILICNEDASIWQGLIADFNAEFQPVGVAEHGLVEEMAAAHLRIRRYWLAEAATLNIEMARQLPEVETKFISITEPQRLSLAIDHFTLPGQPQSHTLGFYHRLESRLRRLYSRSLSDLIKLQQLRAQRQAAAPPPELAIKNDGTNPPVHQLPPTQPIAASSAAIRHNNPDENHRAIPSGIVHAPLGEIPGRLL